MGWIPVSRSAEAQRHWREFTGIASGDDGRTGRLDELQARANDAAHRIDVQRVELDASSKHAARMEREAQAEQEADWRAKTSYEMEP